MYKYNMAIYIKFRQNVSEHELVPLNQFIIVEFSRN